MKNPVYSKQCLKLGCFRSTVDDKLQPFGLRFFYIHTFVRSTMPVDRSLSVSTIRFTTSLYSVVQRDLKISFFGRLAPSSASVHGYTLKLGDR